MMEAEEKGMQRGVKKGFSKGVQEEKIRVLVNMYKNKFDIDTICLVLNLSRNEVEKILKRI